MQSTDASYIGSLHCPYHDEKCAKLDYLNEMCICN